MNPSFILRYAGMGLILASAIGYADGKDVWPVAITGLILLAYSWVAGKLENRNSGKI